MRGLLLALAAAGLRDATAFVAPASRYVCGGASTREPLAAAPLHHHNRRERRRHVFPLFSTTSTEELEAEVKSMRIKEIKSELESYGISTRSFLEKGELVDALVQARAEGKTPMSTTVTPVPSPTATPVPSPPAAAPTADREARLKSELEKCKEMKTSELKSELESLGVSTNSFFEKGEFVKALAEARVDGVKKSKKKKRRASVDDEVEEVTAKVEVITNDSVGPKTKKSRDGSAGDAGGSPFGAGGSPFGGGGGMGGMDMGGIADMLKGMGGMGGAAGANPFGGAGGSPFGAAAGGANPFGGAGGSPFGGAGMPGMEDAMKAMSNPKVQAVMAKAQKNPKVMQAVQESMGNPANMMKYMSDPEVGPILKELQEAMMG
ncbi:hypothetical protein ACHAXT_011939 [Thalassiosira profunda]